jgi:hypothetical protein
VLRARSLLDQVQERQSTADVLLGDAHDEAQVGLNEMSAGAIPVLTVLDQLEAYRVALVFGQRETLTGDEPTLHALGEPDFLLHGEQVGLADFLQIQPHRIGNTLGDTVDDFVTWIDLRDERCVELRGWMRRASQTGKLVSECTPRNEARGLVDDVDSVLEQRAPEFVDRWDIVFDSGKCREHFVRKQETLMLTLGNKARHRDHVGAPLPCGDTEAIPWHGEPTLNGGRPAVARNEVVDDADPSTERGIPRCPEIYTPVFSPIRSIRQICIDFNGRPAPVTAGSAAGSAVGGTARR